ncbi:hypothetical protein [Aquimarina sp. 2201CG5-10]|uniref:hypothetical protein n=1 Tax=Aquimarina callyspongiae TaxID=3098150 RepID=UPI002AB3FEF2|nr:hypothetical protein [Aquimarina sp. 2201CG5-10]MDY8135257.1 hypothetical protein [Aquimarina sp. 2201CG5-10]
MLDKYYKEFNEEKRKLAIKKIASRTDSEEAIVKKVLEQHNPLMDIKGNQVIVVRNWFNRLVKDIEKAKDLSRNIP